MKSQDVFNKNKEKFDSAYEAFDAFYANMEMYYKEKEFNQNELDVVAEIKSIAETLDKGKKHAVTGQHLGYNSWSGDDLTRADGRLATLLITLGEITTDKVQRANVMGKWLKWRRYNEWNPIKSKVEKELGDKKIFKEDIESELGKEIFAESVMESMLAGHADRLESLYDSSKSLLTALAHRINIKKDERQLSQRGK